MLQCYTRYCHGWSLVWPKIAFKIKGYFLVFAVVFVFCLSGDRKFKHIFFSHKKKLRYTIEPQNIWFILNYLIVTKQNA